MREERITSRQNPLLRHAKKLLISRSYRETCGEFAADGTKLLEEAARWVPGLHTVIAADDVEILSFAGGSPRCARPARRDGERSQMDAPQGAIFLCRTPQPPTDGDPAGDALLDGIQDPGNLGTILADGGRAGRASGAPARLRRRVEPEGGARVDGRGVPRRAGFDDAGSGGRKLPVKQGAPACHGAARRRA